MTQVRQKLVPPTDTCQNPQTFLGDQNPVVFKLTSQLLNHLNVLIILSGRRRTSSKKKKARRAVGVSPWGWGGMGWVAVDSIVHGFIPLFVQQTGADQGLGHAVRVAVG